MERSHGQRSRYAPDGRAWLFVADALTLVACTLVAIAMRHAVGASAHDTARGEAVVLLVLDTLVLVRLGLMGQYEQGRRFSRVDDLVDCWRTLVEAAGLTVLAVVAVDMLGLSTHADRRIVAIGTLLPFVALAAVRFVAGARQRAAFRSGRCRSRLLVIGDGDRAARFVDRLERTPDTGYEGVVSAVPLGLGLGEYMRRFVQELESVEPDEVIFALEHPRSALRAAIVREVSYRNVTTRVLADVFEDYYDLPVSRYDGVPVSTVFQTTGDRFARRLKRIADTTLACTGILLLAPFLAVVALLIWLEDRGPVFFTQERVGERGKRFRVVKFRTMRIDAEERLAELREHNEVDGPIFKMRADPRVTRVGRWLRRFSIDEFPQLFNVASSQMSLVGPRPPIPAEVDEYRVEHRRRLMVTPGMTGLWQVSGRSETSFDEMVDLDLAYIANWSPLLDLRILLRTVKVVLSARGAY